MGGGGGWEGVRMGRGKSTGGGCRGLSWVRGARG